MPHPAGGDKTAATAEEMAEEYETITSAANPLVKTLRALERKKGRSETGLFLVEGVRLIEQGLARGWRLDTLVLAAPALIRPHIAELSARARAANARVVSVPEHLLARIARKDNPQMALAAFAQKIRQLEALSRPSEEAALWLGLYEVRDPGNLGTLLRTADCAGLAGLILIGTCCDPYSVEAVRASMGSVFDMPFAQAAFPAVEAWRRDQGALLVAASMNGRRRHDEDIYGQRAVILLGNEQAGLPREVEAACETLARIPMRGGADSLNLAQAGAVMVYEAWRQRGFE